MTIELWDWLEQLDWAVGATFPEADEDALLRDGAAWRTLAAEVRAVGADATSAGTRVVAALADDSGAAFGELWRQVAGGDGVIERLAQACDELAGACHTTAVEVEYAKLEYIGALMALATTLAWLAAALVVGGVSALGMPAAIAATQFAIRTILLRLLTAVAMGVTFNVALDAAAQGIQLAEGHRESWDFGLTARAAEDGAIYGAVFGGVLLGAGRLAPGLFRDGAGLVRNGAAVLGTTAVSGAVGGVVAPVVHGEAPTLQDVLLATTSSALGAGADLAHHPNGHPAPLRDPADLSRLAALDPVNLDAALVSPSTATIAPLTETPGWPDPSSPPDPAGGHLPGSAEAPRADHGILAGSTALADRPAAPPPPVDRPAGAVHADAPSTSPIVSGLASPPPAPPAPHDRPPSSPDRPSSPEPSPDRPTTDRPSPDRSGADRSSPERAAALTGVDRPSAERSSPGQPLPDRSPADRPSSSGPVPDRPSPAGPPPDRPFVSGPLPGRLGAEAPGLTPPDPGPPAARPSAEPLPAGSRSTHPSISDTPRWSVRGAQSDWTGPRGESLTGPAHRAIDAVLDRARTAEPRITGDLRAVADSAGGVLRGEENRLKDPETARLKLARLLRGNADLPRALVRLNDTLRYTVELERGAYTDGVRAALTDLADRGFRPVQDLRRWDPQRGYLGLNTTWSDPTTGHVFEVQFHTPETFQAKTVTHDLYERLRAERPGTPAYRELRRQHDAYFADVPVPPGARDLGLPETGRHDPAPDLPAPDPLGRRADPFADGPARPAEPPAHPVADSDLTPTAAEASVTGTAGADAPVTGTAGADASVSGTAGADASVVDTAGPTDAAPGTGPDASAPGADRYWASDDEARDLVRRNVFATQAGFGFYSPADDSRVWAAALRPVPGYLTLDLHGSPRGFQIESGLITADQLAAGLRDLADAGILDLGGHRGIRLISCDTGVGGEASPAAQLSRALGIEIIAPDQPVWTTLGGSAFVSSTAVVEGMILPKLPPDGSWLRFFPDRTRPT